MKVKSPRRPRRASVGDQFFDSTLDSEQNRNIVLVLKVSTVSKADVAALRASIAAIEGGRRQEKGFLPFGP